MFWGSLIKTAQTRCLSLYRHFRKQNNRLFDRLRTIEAVIEVLFMEKNMPVNRFKQAVLECVQLESSDMHITGGMPLVFRRAGKVFFQKNQVWRAKDIDILAEGLMSAKQKEILRSRWSVDFALSVHHVRLRINIFASTRGLSLAVRLLPGQPPSLEDLNLHPCLRDFCFMPSGLVLICGATGAGKTTTIASMLNEINRNQSSHIITLEDPIEYHFRCIKSFIEQRELGTHVHSYEQGLLDVLREAPDIIVVGELRDEQTMRLTLSAAESGHLVFATLHASTPEEAIYRICNSFPLDSQEFVRIQLSAALAGILVQQLHYFPNLKFRVPILSIVRASKGIKNLIRENKVSQLESFLETSRGEAMFSFEGYKHDFLNNKKQFVPPSVSLRPCKECSSSNGYYSSPLLDPLANSRQPASVIDNTQPEASYVLQSEPSVDDVIAQLERRGGA